MKTAGLLTLVALAVTGLGMADLVSAWASVAEATSPSGNPWSCMA